MDVPAIYRLFETLKKTAKRGRNQSIDMLFEYVQWYWFDGVLKIGPAMSMIFASTMKLSVGMADYGRKQKRNHRTFTTWQRSCIEMHQKLFEIYLGKNPGTPKHLRRELKRRSKLHMRIIGMALSLWIH